jgi:natural product biosynthesis luciferase-like monooxygenase protein
MPPEKTITLTPIQQGMIFHQLLDAHSGMDVEQIVISQSVPFDRSLLRDAWQAVVSAHSALRCVVREGTAAHVLEVLPDHPVEWVEVDPGTDGGFEDWLAADRSRGFEVFRNVPLRLALVQLGDREACVWTFHHLLLDGRSFANVLVDVLDAYDALVAEGRATVTPRPDAAEFGEWLGTRDSEGTIRYWRLLLSGVTAPTPFPVAAPSGTRRRVHRRLSDESMAALERFAMSFDLTINAVVQTAWALVLARYTDEDMVVFGATRAGRHGHVADADRMLGTFIGTVPVRVEVGARSAVEIARTLRDQQRAARGHEHFSLAELEGGLIRTLVMYDHEDLDAAVHRLRPAWQQRRFVLHEQTSYPLTLYAYARPTLGFQLDYSAASLSADRAEAVLDHLVALLTASTEAPHREARRLPMLSVAEQTRLRQEWTATARPRAGTTIHQAFFSSALALPDAPALSGGGRTLTYAETAAAVETVAARLEARGVRPGAVVGVSLDRSVEMVVAILGILRAGAAFLPLDPAYPVDRLRFCAGDAGIALVITQRRYAQRFDSAGIAVCPAEELHSAPTHEHPPARGAGRPQDLAYVIYTSGSTGRPKGVRVTHANVLNFFSGMDEVIDVRGAKKWLAVTSTSFDISMLELLWTLSRGFEVVVHGARPIGSGDRPNWPSFSLFHFASGMDGSDPDPYRLILEAARFADRHGFEAVWSPERHFHDFGAPYPNPSVMSAALATITTRVHLRAGSVVLPLHASFRVAEEWALVDRLSGGRVGVAFASGWQPNDFVLAPERYTDRKALMFEQIEEVRALWRGDGQAVLNPQGDSVRLKSYPRPVQETLPVWITAAGSTETFVRAGEIGANVLTHMLGQGIDDLTAQIAAYRKARLASGHDPATGRVTVMMHTFLGDSTEAVKALVRQPMIRYLQSAAGLVGRYADAWSAYRRGSVEPVGATAMLDLDADESAQLLEFAFERYFDSAGLFGTVERAASLVESLRSAGVDEVACLIDFGVAPDVVIAHLPWIEQLKQLGPRIEQPSTEDLVRAVEAHGITHLQSTPSLARMIPMLARDKQSLSSLRQVLLGGEALPHDLVHQLYELLPPEAVIVNLYGPTETTIWSTADVVQRGADRVTIGRPIANTQCYVVDSKRELVPPGQIGELLIGGAGVADGYHDRPQLDAERFIEVDVDGRLTRVYATGDLVRRLPDGRIEYCGRNDFQVKVRGHRIELGEIETALRAIAGVVDAVVTARHDSLGMLQLVGYLVAAPKAELPDHSVLKSALSRQLPDYMMPSSFLVIDAMPLTPNGKVDRKALPVPAPSVEAASGVTHAPQSEVEAHVQKIWQNVLGRERIGPQENFFLLGGHSILAVKLQSELSKAFGKRIPIAELFRTPTIEGLARHFVPSDAASAPLPPSQGAKRAQMRREVLNRRTGGPGTEREQ